MWIPIYNIRFIGARTTLPAKRHLDRFSRLCIADTSIQHTQTLADGQTDRHTDHATCDICSTSTTWRRCRVKHRNVIAQAAQYAIIAMCIMWTCKRDIFTNKKTTERLTARRVMTSRWRHRIHDNDIQLCVGSCVKQTGDSGRQKWITVVQ